MQGIQTRISLAEGNECTITINVISTELLALLVLSKLKETARRLNVGSEIEYRDE
jgi:hypothetical protein